MSQKSKTLLQKGLECSLLTVLALQQPTDNGEWPLGLAGDAHLRDPNTPAWTMPNAVKKWRDRNHAACLEPNETPTTSDEVKLAEIRRQIRRSRVGRLLHDTIAQQGVASCSMSAFGAMDTGVTGVSDSNRRATGHLIDDKPPTEEYVSTALHEWRHSWQGAETNFSYLDPVRRPFTDVVARGWMREADAVAISVLGVWDLAQNGNPEPLNKLRTDSTYGDMVRAFESELGNKTDEKPTKQDLARATRAAFRAWLKDDFLTNSYYDNYAEFMPKNPMAGTPFEPTGQDIRKFGTMPGMEGASYLSMDEWNLARNTAHKMFHDRTKKPAPPAQRGP